MAQRREKALQEQRVRQEEMHEKIVKETVGDQKRWVGR
jgi:hypothetical protein